MVAALVLESTAQLATLLECSELDFDAPAQGIDVADSLCVERVSVNVGNEDQPPFPRPPVRPNGSFRGLPQKAKS